MVNNSEYAWEDVQVVLFGRTLQGITAVEYTTKKEHNNVYGRGSQPVAMGRGKEECEASITILQSEYEALQRTLPKGKSLVHIPAFNMVVAYAPAGGQITTDVVPYCRFLEIPKGSKQGDTHHEITLKMICGVIQYNV